MNVYDVPGGKRNLGLDTIPRIFDGWEGRKILVGDMNVKNKAWDGNTTDERGKDVLEWVMERGYMVGNDCGTPATFFSTRGESWVDLTISENAQVNEWKVCMEEIMSDDRMIDFCLMGLPKMRRAVVTNVRGNNWDGLERMMSEYHPRRLNTKEEIEREATMLQERLREACMKFIPSSEKVMDMEGERWNVELESLRRQRSLRLERRRRKEEYRRERSRYKRMIRIARVTFLRERVERIQDENPWD
ncbi:uncharacterized protein [Leptinotarsa decemlineata]|uniref:uncharacterized protein n=1 Tax=Leptinotarsa decemlineata TaxID=7539 RepID=UPI003D3074A5